MTRVAILCVSAILAAACTATPVAEKASAVPRQFPLRDFFANPERAYFRLSADGKTWRACWCRPRPAIRCCSASFSAA